MDWILCVATVIGFGLIIARSLKEGEIRMRRGRIRRDEYPLLFYSGLFMHVGTCLLAVAIFSGLFWRIIQWSI